MAWSDAARAAAAEAKRRMKAAHGTQRKRKNESAFDNLTKKILAVGGPSTGFGAKHFKAGLDPNYSGPRYGRSTMMDAFYKAGKLSRTKK